jgi:hypothetical protein
MNSSGTRRVHAVRILSALAVLLHHSTVTFEPGIETSMSLPVCAGYPGDRAGPVSFIRFVCCNCYDRGPGFTGLFSGAGGLLNFIFPGARTVGQRRRASRQSHKSTETPDGRRIRRRDPWVLLERGLHVQQVWCISRLI